MSEWQPIETAPKDGTWFTAYNEAFHGPAVYPCQFDEESELWVGVIDQMFLDGALPTHWMPLTPPPKETGR